MTAEPSRSETLRAGVLSDTHGLLRPEVCTRLAGCDVILHAGDIGPPEILERLREIAPVTAVRGNVDRDPCWDELAEAEVVELDGCDVYLLHDLSRLDLDPRAAGFQVVIYGHSHRPELYERQGVVYLNPGSAGPRRFRLPISMAVLEVRAGVPKIERIDLDL